MNPKELDISRERQHDIERQAAVYRLATESRIAPEPPATITDESPKPPSRRRPFFPALLDWIAEHLHIGPHPPDSGHIKPV